MKKITINVQFDANEEAIRGALEEGASSRQVAVQMREELFASLQFKARVLTVIEEEIVEPFEVERLAQMIVKEVG